MGFESELVVRQVADFDWVLVEPLEYRGNEDLFEVPAEFQTNFASVPAVFVWLIPRSGRYTRAAVLHDHLWRTSKVKSRRRRRNLQAGDGRAQSAVSSPMADVGRRPGSFAG